MLRNTDGVVKVKRENVGEGFFEEVIITMKPKSSSDMAEHRYGARSSSNGEVLIQELRELKALLNALPEI